MTKPIGDPSAVLPRRFPPLAAVVVAALAWGGFVLAGERGLVPAALWDGTGRWMAALHALTLFAVVVLLGDRLALIPWAAALRERHDAGDDDLAGSGWGRRAYELSLPLLPERPASAERVAAIARVRAALERDLLKRWRAPRDLAFIIPVAGLLLMLYNLHLTPLARHWSAVGLPLAVALVEASVVVLLAAWTAREGRSILSAWEDRAVALSRLRLDGGRSEAPIEETEEIGGEVPGEEDEPPPPHSPPPPPPPPPGKGEAEPPQPAPDKGKERRDRTGKGIYNKK